MNYAAPIVSTPESTEGSQILDDIMTWLGRFVVYPSPAAQAAHALWIVHTHLMNEFESTPRIGFLSPEPGSGKSRALEVTEPLVPRPVEAVNVSPAYLFRKIGDENGPPTILFDEIDTVFGPRARENEELRGLLNAGHRRGAVAGRCVVRGKVVETEEIPAFSAVALAGIGELPDTILTRSIVVRMRRRAANERVEPYRRRVNGPQAAALRERIEAWAASLAGTLRDAWPVLPAGIADRDADVWEPLLAIADAAGGPWPDEARVAAVALVASVREANPSLGIQLLHDLRTVFGEREVMSTEAILTALCSLPESLWADLHGKPMNDRGLATRLRKYGVSPKVVRIGESTPRGYTRADLQDAWNRYLGSPPGETQQTQQTQHI